MRLGATVPDSRGSAVQELADQLGLSRSQIIDEALSLFMKAVLEIRRGRRLVTQDPRDLKAVCELMTPTLTALEWALTPDKFELPDASARQDARAGRCSRGAERAFARGREASPSMTEPVAPIYLTRRIGPADPACGFRCGKHPLDAYFRRHAVPNDQGSIGLAYVVEASADDVAAGLPAVLGFYTLSMAAAVSADVGSVIASKLPRYPMPVALEMGARGREIKGARVRGGAAARKAQLESIQAKQARLRKTGTLDADATIRGIGKSKQNLRTVHRQGTRTYADAVVEYDGAHSARVPTPSKATSKHVPKIETLRE